MKFSILFSLLYLFKVTAASAQIRPKADSVMFLSRYVVIGINPGQVQLNGSYSLYVPKGILTEKVRVAIRNSTSWADYVFEPGYRLRPIQDVAQFIQQHKRLPDVPSTPEVMKNGLDLADGQRILLQKVEELTLYIIQQDKRIKQLESKLNARKPR